MYVVTEQGKFVNMATCSSFRTRIDGSDAELYEAILVRAHITGQKSEDVLIRCDKRDEAEGAVARVGRGIKLGSDCVDFRPKDDEERLREGSIQIVNIVANQAAPAGGER